MVAPGTLATHHLSPAAARRVLLTLTLTRWAPIGFVAGIFVLWSLERGLSVSQALTASAITGAVVLAAELPTSGFADAFGRRPVLIASAVAYAVAAAAYLVADSFLAFCVAGALMGAFRALESGPLEAWFVDTVHATEPDADVDRDLAAQGTILGAAMAATALLSGGLVAWHPLKSQSALELPVLILVILTLVNLVAVVALLKEPRAHAHGAMTRARQSVTQTPVVISSALRTVRASRVLQGLIVAEAAWAIALIVFETMQPVRLAELVGGEEQAGVWMGPITAGGWAVYALGSALAGRTSPHLGVARTAILGRFLNAAGALVMGLAAGPVALVAAYGFTYAMHGFTGPMHNALLHREAEAANRSTVLSLNSMVFFGAYSVVAPLLGLLAEATSTGTAMVVAGGLSLLGVLAYVPARRSELRASATATAAELT